jgi:hypothetical protein
VKAKKTPHQRLGGTGQKALDHEERFARVLDAAGDDPASLMLMISVMERIIADRGSRRKQEGRSNSY